jgi:hypothetical protein
MRRRIALPLSALVLAGCSLGNITTFPVYLPFAERSIDVSDLVGDADVHSLELLPVPAAFDGDGGEDRIILRRGFVDQDDTVTILSSAGALELSFSTPGFDSRALPWVSPDGDLFFGQYRLDLSTTISPALENFATSDVWQNTAFLNSNYHNPQFTFKTYLEVVDPLSTGDWELQRRYEPSPPPAPPFGSHWGLGGALDPMGDLGSDVTLLDAAEFEALMLKLFPNQDSWLGGTGIHDFRPAVVLDPFDAGNGEEYYVLTFRLYGPPEIEEAVIVLVYKQFDLADISGTVPTPSDLVESFAIPYVREPIMFFDDVLIAVTQDNGREQWEAWSFTGEMISAFDFGDTEDIRVGFPMDGTGYFVYSAIDQFLYFCRPWWEAR